VEGNERGTRCLELDLVLKVAGVGRKADDLAVQNIFVAKSRELKNTWRTSDRSVEIFSERLMAQKGLFCE
jgi:hypothetical protein